MLNLVDQNFEESANLLDEKLAMNKNQSNVYLNGKNEPQGELKVVVSELSKSKVKALKLDIPQTQAVSQKPTSPSKSLGNKIILWKGLLLNFTMFFILNSKFWL